MAFIKNKQPDEIFSSATLSNANIIERVIPELKSKLKKVSEDRAYMGSDGIPRYADGSIIPNMRRLTDEQT